VLNPFTSEQDAFKFLLYVSAVVAIIVIVVLIGRAIF
jgi:hypothetical protein